MKITVNDERYGKIEYFESFWTGKKIITINGKEFSKHRRKEFVYGTGANQEVIELMGSFLGGTKVDINGYEITLTEKPTLLEWLLAVIPLIVVIIWGNSPALCKILPIVGGAIGGGISGGISMIGLMYMKQTNNFIYKLAIAFISVVAAVLICFLIATFLLASN